MASGPKPGSETTRIHMKYDAWNRMVEVKADACTNCEECLGKCPYDLPIPDLLEEAHRLLS